MDATDGTHPDRRRSCPAAHLRCPGDERSARSGAPGSGT